MDFDEETRKEVMDAFNDLYEQIDYSISRLNAASADDELHALFRAVHSVKGNAGMLQIHTIVNFTHALEDIAAALRARNYPPDPLICEVLHLGMDRVKDLHLRDVAGNDIENIHEDEIAPMFRRLAQAEAHAVTGVAREILTTLGAGVECEPTAGVEAVAGGPARQGDASLAAGRQTDHDLAFFRELALQLDKQTQYWEGRSEQIAEWAQKLNRLGGNVVDDDQFAAAIYLHDIGMCFVPNSILNKQGRLEADEQEQIRRHPQWGYQFLIRMPGWEEAARIVQEHQEHFNGQGYPGGLAAEDIHPAARLLAVIDAFFSMTAGRADRSQRRSVVRAISEINSRSGSQFDPFWVRCLNDMIKEGIKAGHL